MIKAIKYIIHNYLYGLPHTEQVADLIEERDYSSENQVQKIALAYALEHTVEDIADIFRVTPVRVRLCILKFMARRS